MDRMLIGVVVLSILEACSTSGPSKAAHRLDIQEVGGATVKLVPAEGQLPFCLVFTVSEKGVVRQLTMNRDHQSASCGAGKAVGGAVYKIPVEEGPVRMHVIFSDRKLDSDPVAQQVHELAALNPAFSAMDLRAPGTVTIETLQYAPSLEAEGITVVGSQVAVDDGGSPGKPGSAPIPPGAAAPTARP